MKSKQSIVFNKIRNLHYPMMEEWFYHIPQYHYQLEAFSNSPEEFHLIANAANKFWNLVSE